MNTFPMEKKKKNMASYNLKFYLSNDIGFCIYKKYSELTSIENKHIYKILADFITFLAVKG